jgi:hypothetical protein
VNVQVKEVGTDRAFSTYKRVEKLMKVFHKKILMERDN